MLLKMIALALIGLSSFTGYAVVAREQISERLTAIDGSAFRQDQTVFRLWGVDAPPLSAHCSGSGLPWRCGAAARDALQSFIAKHKIECIERGAKPSGQKTYVCESGAVGDLAYWLVSNGWAVDNMAETGGIHLNAQWAAQREQRGVWAEG